MRTRPRSVLQRSVAGAAAAAMAALGAGCAQQVAAAPQAIQVSPAYIGQPGSNKATLAFMAIQNDTRTADRLVAASTSVGGRVEMLKAGRDAVRPQRVPDIPVPAGSTVRLRPTGYLLLVVDPGRMQAGREITITLDFAHAGPVKVLASVTNPQTGGNSYFLN